MKTFFINLILFYQRYISILMAPCCRFYPSCSQYTLDAVSKYGVIKGLFMGSKRLCRCHPLCHGGLDPVPQKPKES